MLVTEDQAAALWCPAVRYTEGTEDGGCNRFRNNKGLIVNPQACRCVASKCMWWRWDPDLYVRGNSAVERVTGEQIPPEERRGYCGMAGTP